MRALEIRRNGKVICLAGMPNGILLTADLSANVEEPAAGLSVYGVADLGEGRRSHHWWLNHLEVRDGDNLQFMLVESDTATPFLEEIADAPESTVEQQEHEEYLMENPMGPRKMARLNKNLSFRFATKTGSGTAQIPEPHEYLSAHLTWTNIGSECCRFYVSSYSQLDALEKREGKEWLNESLDIKGDCAVRLRYEMSPNPALAASR